MQGGGARTSSQHCFRGDASNTKTWTLLRAAESAVVSLLLAPDCEISHISATARKAADSYRKPQKAAE
eukprot:11904449-Alexandrium_andersonii.AAC.1